MRHETILEMALTSLQEATEQEIIKNDDLHGYHAIHNAATVSGGASANRMKIAAIDMLSTPTPTPR